MGYTHYWHRPGVIAQNSFHTIRSDFEQLVLPLADAGVELAGGRGEGPPEITDELIRFNGVEQCGHSNNEDIVPYPSEDAEGIGPGSTAIDDDSEGVITQVKHRC